MTINDTHDFIYFLLSKSKSAFFNRAEIDQALDRAQMGFFSTNLAAFDETGFLHSSLNPFRRKLVFTSSIDGVVTAGSDSQHITGMYITSFSNTTGKVYTPVKFYKEDELGDALVSQVRPVTKDSPIAYQSNSGTFPLLPTVTILPSGKYEGNLHYLRRPSKPKYNFVQTGRMEEFSEYGSQDLEWADGYVNAIIMKALEFLGINVNTPDLMRYAAQKASNNIGPDKV